LSDTATITDTNRLEQKFIFPHFSSLKVQKQGADKVGFWLGLAPWLVEDHLISMSSYGLFLCVHMLLVPLPLLLRTLLLWDQGPTLRTSFNLHYLIKGPVSKYSI
jgi:hypothetical protein